MSKLVDIRGNEIKSQVVDRIEAMDVKDKVVFVFMPDKELRSYYGDRAWEDVRRLGARAVIFTPNHIRIEAFSDEELAVIGLQRIKEEGEEE